MTASRSRSRRRWLVAGDRGRLRRRRDEFIARVGDYNAPLSADHVYMYLHQTRWNEDNDTELAWHREREIARMEASWDAEPPSSDEPADEDELHGAVGRGW